MGKRGPRRRYGPGRCTCCGGRGPFARAKTGHRGQASRCKKCVKEASQKWLQSSQGRASRMWSSLVDRCCGMRYYENICVALARSEFLAWAVPAIRRWLRQHPGETPSIDRKDSRGDYALDNLRIVTRGENTKNREYHRSAKAPHGKAWCGRCKRYLPISSFSTRPSRVIPGVQGMCRRCFAEYTRARRSKGRPSQATYLREWRQRKLREDPLYFKKKGRR